MYWTAGNMMMMERLWLRMKADDDDGGYDDGQGCISCGILLSGTWARGVSSEHMENMEMFSCSPT